MAAIDVRDFPLATLRGFERVQEVPEDPTAVNVDARVPGLSAVVTWTGRVRPLSEDRTRMLRMTFRMLGAPEFAALYKDEIEVVEQGRRSWIPCQRKLLKDFRREIHPGNAALLFLRYVGSGVLMGGHLYAMVEFQADPPPPPVPGECFASKLAGVRLGEPFAAAVDRLRAEYGPPPTLEGDLTERDVAFRIDDRNTILILRNAPGEFEDRVFRIQVTGPPNPSREVAPGLRLGDSESRVIQALGRPVAREESGEGFTRWHFGNPRCSVEMWNERLASILIFDDPDFPAELTASSTQPAQTDAAGPGPPPSPNSMSAGDK